MASTTILSDNGVSSGSAGYKITAGNDGVLILQTTTSGGTATNALAIDTSQNVGVGVTPSAWGGSAGSGVLQLKNGGVLFTNTLKDTYLGANYYFDGSVNKYIASGFASQFGVSASTGGFSWNAAASGSAGATATLNTLMTLLQSGNLGIGVASPTAKLQVASGGTILQGSTLPTYTGTNYATLNINNNSADGTVDFTQGIVFSDNSVNTGAWGHAGITSVGSSGYAGALVFGTDGGTQDFSITERGRFDYNGNFLVASTSAAWNIGGAIQCKGITSHAGQNGAYQNNGINLEWRSGALRIWVDTTDLGTVQFASDYRLKKDVQTQTVTALDRIEQVRPVTFEFGDYGDLFKGDGVAREGFIAHELAEVIPSAVDGEKDCENQIQTLRLDALCSVMVKAIQELNAKVDAQAAEIAALKG